ncbi:hypothetical protein [Simiduia aestuariiviva]|uniref:Ribosomal protein L7/L12 C-terminal domain-containing protein n=1 Tax=Simiduia aestuariiviva TaxID=1510459 RepID=A0A839UVC0_9GAMM|nr:hypothetical protein [Simiduia aestuariiviva]MBB3169295.1 hypothetical protein [Simiduia aestuariiviva]
MSDDKFDIVFRGDIAVGQSLPQVKQRLAALFKRDAAQIDALFTGMPVPLKKNVDHASAEKYQKVLMQAGAIVEIRPAGTLKPAAARARPAAAAPKSEPKPEPKPEPKSEPISEPKATESIGAPAMAASSGLSLVPVGGDILTDAERAATATPAAEVSALDAELRPLEGRLVDEQEIERMPPVDVPNAEFDIADPGVALIEPEYRTEVAPVAVPDLAADLAPPGSDLGQIPKAPAPPPPDTSGIQLAD